MEFSSPARRNLRGKEDAFGCQVTGWRLVTEEKGQARYSSGEVSSRGAKNYLQVPACRESDAQFPDILTPVLYLRLEVLDSVLFLYSNLCPDRLMAEQRLDCDCARPSLHATRD